MFELSDAIEKDLDEKLDLSTEEQIEKSDDSHIERIKSVFKIKNGNSDNLARLIFYLGSKKRKWRNLKVLSKRTGLEMDAIEDILGKYPKRFTRGKGVTGNVIYRLTDSARTRYDEELNEE